MCTRFVCMYVHVFAKHCIICFVFFEKLIRACIHQFQPKQTTVNIVYTEYIYLLRKRTHTCNEWMDEFHKCEFFEAKSYDQTHSAYFFFSHYNHHHRHYKVTSTSSNDDDDENDGMNAAVAVVYICIATFFFFSFLIIIIQRHKNHSFTSWYLSSSS